MNKIKHLLKSPVSTWVMQLTDFYYKNINKNKKMYYPKSIFVLSTGRTGTATLADLGKLCKREILSVHEPSPTLYSLSKAAYETTGMEKHLERCIYEARRQLFQRATNTHRTYFETSPQCTFLAPLLTNIIKESKFIHVIREKNAFIKSGITRKWYIGNNNDPFRLSAPEHYTQKDKISWLYDTTNEWIETFLCTQNKNNYITIKSEEMFQDSSQCINAIFNLAQIPPPSKKKIKSVLKKKLNANLNSIK